MDFKVIINYALGVAIGMLVYSMVSKAITKKDADALDLTEE